MNLYNIKNLTEKVIDNGASINILTDALMELSSHPQFETMDKLTPYDLTHLSFKNDLNIMENPNIIHRSTLKTGTILVTEKDSVINFEYENKTYYFKTFKGKLHLSDNLEELNKVTQKEDISHLSVEEKRAYAWLEGKNTGLSSMAMCNHLFPQLKHYKLENLRNDKFDGVKSYPHDNADFRRCLNFLKEVSVDNNQLNTLRDISPIWNKLINNWDSINQLLNEKKNQEAYYLIKECSKQNKPKI